jgi:predicted metalloprotease with PDZ domain
LSAILISSLFTITIFAAPITIRVDAADAPSHLLHAHLSIPATPGPLALFYPKWIPGEPGPTGPIVGLSGLRFSANGTAVTWTRDPVEMYEFHVDVPAGASALDVDLDYLIPPPGMSFTAGASASPKLAVLSWNTVILYPQSPSSDALQYDPTLRLPSGWKYATALETRSNTSSEIHFETVSLTTLVDSPVQAGVNLKSIDIPNGTGLRHTLNLASESAFALETPSDFATRYSRLVDEASALFGANHYRHYDWLFTLSNQVEHFGLEHHESSDDRTSEDNITDEEQRKWVSTLLALDASTPQQRTVSAAGRTRDFELREADDRRAALGLRRPHQLPRRAPAVSQRTADGRGVPRSGGGECCRDD